MQSIPYTLGKEPKSLVNTKVSAYAQTDRKQLPQSFADDKTAKCQAAAQASLSEEDWEVNIRANIKDIDMIDDKGVSFEGSYLAGKYTNQWLIVGQISTWWGPGY